MIKDQVVYVLLGVLCFKLLSYTFEDTSISSSTTINTIYIVCTIILLIFSKT